MGARLHRDIEIRGVVYPTAQAAARALGVQAQTVRKAAQRGTLDSVGLGLSHPRPMPVRIRGRVYPSARAAAAALGVSQGAIRQALARGDPDSVGRRRYNGARARPVAIGGLQFASMAEASRALGFSQSYVSKVLRGRSPVSRQRLLGAAMQLALARERVAA